MSIKFYLTGKYKMNIKFYLKCILSSLCALVFFLNVPFLSLNVTSDVASGATSDVSPSVSLIFSTSKAYAAEKTANKDKITDEKLKAALVKLLQDNPEIIFEVLQDNSEELIRTITIASEKARAANQKKGWEQDLQKPKKMGVKNRPRLGKSNAKNIVFGYSDFLCSYCAQAAQTIHTLIGRRTDTQFIFKSIPNNDRSRIATRWFYQIDKEDSKKAWQFHDGIFAKQQAFAANPMPVIREIAKKIGLDVDSTEKAVNANQKKLDALIDVDIKEAKDMGFEGTPYFVVNGAVLRGARPVQTFEDAIEFTNKNKR